MVGFWLVHLLDRRDMTAEPLADLFARAARGELRAARRRDLPDEDVRPRPRGPRRPAHQRQARCWIPTLRRPHSIGRMRSLPSWAYLSRCSTPSAPRLPGATPIQEQTIPPLLEGQDVIGQAQTGTGKTAAFGLPMLEYLDPVDAEVQALVLTPTRELCIQVTQALRAYGEQRGIEVVAVFGGAPIRDQARG